jgi:pimeloyl-ACP methyl ester carboxylesterase
MARRLSYSVGSYAAGEASVELTRTDFRPDRTKRGVLVAPAHGGHAIDAFAPTYTNLQLQAIVDAGIPILGVDAGGPVAWGNDTAIARIGDGKTYLTGTVGAKTDKVLLWAFSMAGLSMLNWARTNLASVAAIGLVCPAVDLADLHNNRGYGTEIDTAYGGSAAYAAALPTHSPVQFAASLTVPCKVWYGLSDPTVVPSTVQAFVAAYGGPITSVPVTGGVHTPFNAPAQDMADWMSANL